MRKPMSIPSSISARASLRAATTDERWMSRALELAAEGAALAHPNPVVGAVLVKNGRAIGEGFHEYDKRDHAEVVALKQAGSKGRGATLYVTLEPCCTTGRTGPCTQAIIAAGVKRVVAAMRDPNPAVSGKGFAQLRRAGIEVVAGVNEDAARQLNEGFASWIRTRLPFVTMKSAMTLDGQIAMRSGSVTWITSEASLKEVQNIRHASDALLTGIGTVLADNPRMSDRSGKPRRRNLLRAVVDSRLRMPLKSSMVQSAQGDLVIFTTQPADSPKARALARAGAEIVQLRAHGGHVDLKAVVRELGRREILNLLIEGGAELNGAAIESGIVDKLILFYAPRVMGTGGVPFAGMPAARWFPKSSLLANLSLRRYGPDFVVEGYFHDVYGDHRSRRKN
jgi:diaminohydroxyphosphoribosylaminopyrimidine deaminase/5-amino-6-(5-phosphoribosylamino)uracil reductase